MSADLWARAAFNNAAWCDAVCAARHKPGAFLDHIWVQRHGSPPYYPDAVTLTAGGIHQQEQCIVDLSQLRPSGLAVKDSFCGLELGRFGFQVLFETSWIAVPIPARSSSGNDTLWHQVNSSEDLQRWEAAWSGNDQIDESSRTFLPNLLANPDIRFLLALDEGNPIGGGILNRAAGVVGLSNVFSCGMPAESLWRGLIAQAARQFPGLPLVGYERGDDLTMALRAGFEPIGRLRVWLRP
ncbi:hypothetical protein [Pseudaminobacter soli (ex Li et al. 2025)]|uniref:Uncharacterized protein n=1 Tax=Pseudaminobacter soli (ex Li et al. 2025) TaxID=1295366 RepID=A0A2P7SMI1_9HYPH|nr:hypothetical protein [Mesorhizobium soli]PSJ63704.1 hypothetical protein C7I85_00790 [Mesorhizobium soli]